MKVTPPQWFSRREVIGEREPQKGEAAEAFDNQASEPDDDSDSFLCYPARTELFRQGYFPDAAFFIKTGLIKFVRLESDGREMITDLRYPGSVLGAVEIIAQQPHALTAITVTECHLKRFSAESFLSRLKTDPQMSWNVHQSHSLELRHQRARTIELCLLPARQRLESLLFRLFSISVSEPAPSRFHLPLKDWEVAALIAITPSYLSRLLDELEKEGLIMKRGRNLTIPDPLSLWHWADEQLPSS